MHRYPSQHRHWHTAHGAVVLRRPIFRPARLPASVRLRTSVGSAVNWTRTPLPSSSCWPCRQGWTSNGTLPLITSLSPPSVCTVSPLSSPPPPADSRHVLLIVDRLGLGLDALHGRTVGHQPVSVDAPGPTQTGPVCRVRLWLGRLCLLSDPDTARHTASRHTSVMADSTSDVSHQ